MPEPTTTAIQRAELLNVVSALPKLHYDVHGMVQYILIELDAAETQASRYRELSGVLGQFALQEERWKIPMPKLEGGEHEAVYVWCLKAQEELGELSAALLGKILDQEGRGNPLEEVDQLIAVLLRIHVVLEEAHDAQ